MTTQLIYQYNVLYLNIFRYCVITLNIQDFIHNAHSSSLGCFATNIKCIYMNRSLTDSLKHQI